LNDPVASEPDFSRLAGLPADEDGPVFNAPWEAQAFAMAVKLHEQGVFSWNEWAEKLGAAIKAAQGEGDPDLGNTYYLHWLAALEGLVAEKGVLTGEMMAARKEEIREEWERTHSLHGGHDH